MIVRVPGGFRIRSHTNGKTLPHVYTSSDEAQRRIDQMLRFSEWKHKQRSAAYDRASMR